MDFCKLPKIDKVEAADMSCLLGPVGSHAVRRDFEALNELCKIPAFLTSYTLLTFYRVDKEVAGLDCLCTDWARLKELQ